MAASALIVRAQDIVRNNAVLFAKFGAVGAVGFLVDAGVLFAALDLGAGPFVGRAASACAAMTTTWLLNRWFTFAVREPAGVGEVARYGAAKSVGLLINLAVYSIIVLTAPGLHPVFALAIATGAAALVNFALVKRFVFPARAPE